MASDNEAMRLDPVVTVNAAFSRKAAGVAGAILGR